MDKQTLMKFITKNTAVILAIICLFCLFAGNSATTGIYTVAYVLLTLIAMPSYFLMLFWPTKMGIRMSICLNKKDQKDIDISVWDAYVEKYENRYSSLHSWIDLAAHLSILAMFMAAEIWFVVYMDIICTAMGEAATWRLYKTIKNKKTMWGAAAFLHDIQESFKQ